MKKFLFILLVPVIGAAAAVYFLSAKAPGPVMPQPVVSILPDNKATSTPKTKAPASAGQYAGQALSYLGAPEVLARYPKAFVDGGRERLARAIEMIGKDPKNGANWMELGLVKKAFENYTGVRDAWEYAKILSPNDAINYYNLGNLYSAYLKDNTKAEKDYLQALNLDSYNYYPYLGLAQFYMDFYKEKSALAPQVLLNGLKVLPNEPSLLLALASYYRDIAKDNAKAADYFEQYLKTAKDLDERHQQLLEEEIAKLRSNY